MKFESDLSSCGDLLEVSLPPVVLMPGNLTETTTGDPYQVFPITIAEYDVTVTEKEYTYTM